MPLIQYGPALGVGVSGENELLDLETHDELDETRFLERVNSSLPDGLRFKALKTLSAGSKSLIKEVNRAEYRVAIDAPEITAAVERLRIARAEFGRFSLAEVHEILVREFMSCSSHVIERARRDRRQTIDVRRHTIGVSTGRDSRGLRIVTELSANGSVKPVEVVGAIYGLTQQEMLALNSRVCRVRLYFEDESSREVSFASELAAPAGAAL
jgi:radical SAM-linked protein